MSTSDETVRSLLSAAKTSESGSKCAVSFGLATVMMATSAIAQEATAPEPLPPLDVVAKQKAKKKAAAKPKSTPAPTPTAASDEAQPATGAEPAFGTGETLTPSTGNTLQSGTGLGRLQGTVQDTPQTINVVPQKQLQEQQATTLDQALRNVPGVTVAIGEGGGGMNGDQFRIRGFQAKGDIYVDGLRDFGVYVRDSFALEQVEVIKGPASESFGMGTTGGAINIQQKRRISAMRPASRARSARVRSIARRSTSTSRSTRRLPHAPSACGKTRSSWTAIIFIPTAGASSARWASVSARTRRSR